MYVWCVFCAVEKSSRGSGTDSEAFSALSCYMFMTGSWRCRWVFLAPTCLASCSCRRPLCLFLSLLLSPHPTLHDIPSPPSAATLIPRFFSSVFPCPLTISVVFFHALSTSIIIISLWVPHRFLLPLCAASHLLLLFLSNSPTPVKWTLPTAHAPPPCHKQLWLEAIYVCFCLRHLKGQRPCQHQGRHGPRMPLLMPDNSERF